MGTERNRARMIRLYEEAFNAGRLDVVDECIAPGASEHGHPLAPGDEDLAAHVRNVVVMLRDALPDLHVEIEETVAEDDRVFARLTTTGTHTGAPLFGCPALGRPVHVTGFHLIQFDADGRAVRDAGNFGVEEFVRQVRHPEAVGSAPAGASR